MAQKSCSSCGGRVVGSKPDKGTPAADLCNECIKKNLRDGANPFAKVEETEADPALVDA